jgi:hypothetical protein
MPRVVRNTAILGRRGRFGMRSDWPSVMKVCIALTLVSFIGGLAYRFVYLRGSGIDLEHFASYVLAALLLFVSDHVMKHFLLRVVKIATLSFSAKAQLDELHEANNSRLGYLYGGLLPLAQWPLVLITVTPIATLWGQNWADDFERLSLKLLGLESMTSTSSKLIFFSVWFLIGMLILNLGLRFYWMRLSKPESVEPA